MIYHLLTFLVLEKGLKPKPIMIRLREIIDPFYFDDSLLVNGEFIWFVGTSTKPKSKKVSVVLEDELTHKKMSVYIEGKGESCALNSQNRRIHETWVTSTNSSSKKN